MNNVGYYIKKGVLDCDIHWLESFRTIPVPNIGDAMNRVGAVSSALHPANSHRLLGPAYTVRVPAGDNLLFYYAINQAPEGFVIVVDGDGYTERALCGEIMATLAKKKKLAGFVVDGAVRDWEELARMDFPVFARACSPNGPYKNGPGEINVPVNIGGKVVEPGDIMIGDRGGMVVLRREEAPDILEKALQIQQKEKKMMEQINQTGNLDLEWMYRKLKADGCQIEEEGF